MRSTGGSMARTTDATRSSSLLEMASGPWEASHFQARFIGEWLPALIAGATLALGCGAGEPPPRVPIQVLGPEDEILSVSSSWESRQRDKELRSEPSSISVYEVSEVSRLEFVSGASVASELLALEEVFLMRNGQSFRCRSEQRFEVAVRFAPKGEEPAVQVQRPAATLTRVCEPPGFPEPMLSLPARISRFVLRDEQLVAFDPPLEKRLFLPAQ